MQKSTKFKLSTPYVVTSATFTLRHVFQLFSDASEEAQQLRVVFVVSKALLENFKGLADQMNVNLATDVSMAVTGTSGVLVSKDWQKYLSIVP